MNKYGVKILGTGSFMPPKVLTNADLEKMVQTSDEWITTRTGIKERRIADEKTATSDLAIEAAKKALEEAKLKPEDIDMIIVATVTPDMSFPSTACFVQKGLGASRAAAFDLAAACSGFIYGISIAKNFIENGTYKHILLIGAETLSKITDWQDRNTCVLFGDGAGAMVLARTEGPSSLLSVYLGADGNYDKLLILPGGGSRNPVSKETMDNRLHFIKMAGKEVFKVAVTKMAEAAEKALEAAGKTPADLDLIIPHQANLRIIEAIAKRMDYPLEKVYVNLHKYGN
ncbi:MAG: 3-oxoacyl-ACP synthase, partial [Elusimicrobia bacterium RIFOXYB1_FULL_48_9]